MHDRHDSGRAEGLSPEPMDISPFVTEQTRRAIGKRLANPKVKELLDAGLDLLLGGVESNMEAPFRFPSADAVCTEAARRPAFNPTPVPAPADEAERLFGRISPADSPQRRSAVNAFRKTWPQLEQYRADLAMYALTMPTWFAGDEVAKHALEQMTADTDAIDAVLERIACEDLKLFEDALFRVQLVMQAMAPSETVIREALDRMYANIDRTWILVYQGILDHYKAELRPDVTVEDMTYMLTAAAEGTGLRLLVQPGNKAIADAVRRRSILGKTALCVFAASIGGRGDTRTLGKFFRDRLTGDEG
ncbi:hypothetical protein AB0J72_29200 [Dactylosporangium sp. NPDC049742]|uniref:hypothetical protein n=1 Tax=Dactylosporangium sp. NPDC049742 TaxID=3154737 RepID=UPI00341BCAD3